MRAKNSNGFAGLHQQRFVIFERAEGIDDGLIAIPVAGRLATSAVDDQVFGLLGHFRVEVVHQHTQRRFLAGGHPIRSHGAVG